MICSENSACFLLKMAKSLIFFLQQIQSFHFKVEKRKFFDFKNLEKSNFQVKVLKVPLHPRITDWLEFRPSFVNFVFWRLFLVFIAHGLITDSKFMIESSVLIFTAKFSSFLQVYAHVL